MKQIANIFGAAADQIMALDIAEVSSPRSFVFLWCGSSDGLDLGRLCLQNWGFRRCEDICWIRTNIKNKGEGDCSTQGGGGDKL